MASPGRTTEISSCGLPFSSAVVAVGRPLPGNRNDYKAGELSGAKAAVGRTTVGADGGYQGTGLVIPHRREPGQAALASYHRNQ